MFAEVVIVILISQIFTCFGYSTEKYDSMQELFHFDDFENCLNEKNQNFSYCSITIQLRPEDNSPNEIWETIKKFSSDTKHFYRHDLLRHGVCISNMNPQKNQINSYYAQKYNKQRLLTEIVEMDCQNRRENFIQKEDIIVGTLLGIYGIFLIFTSTYLERKEFKSKDRLSKTEIILSNFSIKKNVYDLFNRKHKIQNYMPFLQGIRFFVSIIIIASHSGVILALPTATPSFIENALGRFLVIFLQRIASLVQTFFVISAWLLTVNFYQKLKKNNEVGLKGVFENILKRYIRFTPGQMILIALHATWLNHLNHGPFWKPFMGFEYEKCTQKWWGNVFYFNNFLMEDGACLAHTWSLSVDFQLTIFGLVVLWATQKNRKTLIKIFGFTTLFQITFLFFYLFWNNFEFGVLLTPELMYHFKFTLTREWNASWTSTYSNLAGHISGMFFGYIYVHEVEKFKQVYKHKRFWRFLSIFLIFGIPLSSAYYMSTDYYSNNRLFAAVFGTLIKPFFVFGIGLFIFGISQGLGGSIKKLLESHPMQILGQLSFGAYLIHVSFLEIDVSLRTSPIYVTGFTIVYFAIKNIILAYLGSLVFSLLFLMPIDNLSKYLLK